MSSIAGEAGLSLAAAAHLQEATDHNLQSYVEAFVEETGLPALSVAIWRDGELFEGAAGVLNQETGVEANTESIFQIGSITKVMTAALVMQLVDEGLVELDEPVRRYLRDFQILDKHASDTITVRQLLNHTNGIAGDFFPDDQEADGNLIARYVDRCNALPLVHQPGEMYSYSNAAYSIAGRLVEVMRGMTWAQAMRDYIYKPLGMTHAIADLKDAIRFRMAVGHIPDEKHPDKWHVPDELFLSLGQAPCGSTPTMRARDLVLFARPFMEGGKASDGLGWLSDNAVDDMQSPSFSLPRVSKASQRHVGLGWHLTHHFDSDLWFTQHGGGVRGQLSMLQVIPERNAVIAVLTNGYKMQMLEKVLHDLQMTFLGVSLKEAPPEVIDLSEVELRNIAGRYESFDAIIDIAFQDGALNAHVIYKIDPSPPTDFSLKPLSEDIFAPFTESGPGKNWVFIRSDLGATPDYVFFGGRLTTRVATL